MPFWCTLLLACNACLCSQSIIHHSTDHLMQIKDPYILPPNILGVLAGTFFVLTSYGVATTKVRDDDRGFAVDSLTGSINVAATGSSMTCESQCEWVTKQPCFSRCLSVTRVWYKVDSQGQAVVSVMQTSVIPFRRNSRSVRFRAKAIQWGWGSVTTSSFPPASETLASLNIQIFEPDAHCESWLSKC